MKKIWNKNFILISLGGFFLFVDQIIKYLSLNVFTTKHLFKGLGWYPFKNPGIAFGINIPLLLIISLSLIIIILISVIWKKQNTLQSKLGLTLVLSGAISNLIDRLIYNHTIDYFAFFTGIINLADTLIVVGFIIYLFSKKK